MKKLIYIGSLIVVCIVMVACSKQGSEITENTVGGVEQQKENIENNSFLTKDDEEIISGDGWYFLDGKLYVTKIYYTVIGLSGGSRCLYEQPWISKLNQNFIKEIEIDGDMVYTSVSSITQTEYPDVVDPDEDFAGGGPLFGNTSSLESITIKKLYLDKITDISYMFCNNENLVNVDVSGLQTSNVTDVTGLFRGNEKMVYIDLENWDTSKFETVENIFAGCTGLKTIKVSSWDTENVKNFRCAFAGCESLKDIDLAGWTVNDVAVAGMFSDCTNLVNVNFPNVTLKDEVADNIFDENNSIVSYHFADGWDIYVDKFKPVGPIGDDCYVANVGYEPMSGVVAVCIYYNKLMPDWYKKSVEYRQNVYDFTNIYSTEQMDVWVDVVDREFSATDVLHAMLDAMSAAEALSSDGNVIIGNAVDKIEILLNASKGEISVEDVKDLLEMSEEEIEIWLEE